MKVSNECLLFVYSPLASAVSELKAVYKTSFRIVFAQSRWKIFGISSFLPLMAKMYLGSDMSSYRCNLSKR